MGTIVGIETGSGTILAGDRRVVSGNTIRSDNKQKVFDFPSVGTAATGEPGRIDEFSRMLESEIQKYRTEQGKEMEIQHLANVGATVAETVGVDAIVSASDDKAIAQIREIGDDGRILDDKVLALGSVRRLHSAGSNEPIWMWISTPRSHLSGSFLIPSPSTIR